MNQAKRLSKTRWREIALLLFAVAIPSALMLACAGANGDPAPAAQEAGSTSPVACVDAGVTE